MPAGEIVSLAIVLVGRALDQLPLIVYALQRAFSSGIGRLRARGSLVDITLEGPDGAESVWDAQSSSIGTHEQMLSVPFLPDFDAVTLNILTPLRLQNQGHRVPIDRLHPRTLFAALLRRISLLFELHAALPGLAGDARRLAAASDESRRRTLLAVEGLEPLFEPPRSGDDPGRGYRRMDAVG